MLMNDELINRHHLIRSCVPAGTCAITTHTKNEETKINGKENNSSQKLEKFLFCIFCGAIPNPEPYEFNEKRT